MSNFPAKNFGFTPFMNETRAIIKPNLPYLCSKLPEACALFGCSHISGYIKLSLVWMGYEIVSLFEGVNDSMPATALSLSGGL